MRHGGDAEVLGQSRERHGGEWLPAQTAEHEPGAIAQFLYVVQDRERPARERDAVIPLRLHARGGDGPDARVQVHFIPRRPTAPPARPSYAVPRRTRRRGGAVRGAAVRVGWGRPPRGVACACCAR